MKRTEERSGEEFVLVVLEPVKELGEGRLLAQVMAIIEPVEAEEVEGGGLSP